MCAVTLSKVNRGAVRPPQNMTVTMVISEVVVRNICRASVIVFCIAYKTEHEEGNDIDYDINNLPMQKPLLLVSPRTRACVGS